MPLTRLLGILLLSCTLLSAAPMNFSLETLRSDHPRLLLTAEREAELRALAAQEPFLAELVQHLRAAADWALTAPVEEYRLVGPRLLAQSRACLGKVTVLALAARWFDDARYVDRAWRELEAAANFPDWNPAHFLDTAEMSAAFALGYDWLYDRWTPEQRLTLRRTLIEKGLRPGLEPGGQAAVRKENNWNPVCNAGLVLGALAIAEHEPELARALLAQAAATLDRAVRHYAPDGAWYEGPGYWKYGTTYLVMLAAALETALGHDGGIGARAGLARTGDFFRDAVGPSWGLFNYADSSPRPGSAPALFWLARRFEAPRLAAFEHALLRRHLGLLAQRSAARGVSRADEQAVKLGDVELADLVFSNRFFALELVWFQPDAPLPPPQSTHYRGVADVAFLRSPADSPHSFYLAAKGAGVPNPHAHLDAGSFVLDYRGVRWAEDLGMENYDLPGFWEMAEGGRRWTYFRTNSQSHNVVTLDGRNQRTPARVPLTAFASTPGRAQARFDLSDAYREQAGQVLRGFALVAGQRVLIQDELLGLAGAPATARWAILTAAEIELNGRVATLSRHGEKLRVTLLQPTSARWAVRSAEPPTAAETPNPEHRLLVFEATVTPGELTKFAVQIEPLAVPHEPLPLTPLAKWDDGALAR